MDAASPLNFALRARQIQAQLRGEGLPISDMRRAVTLELQYAGFSAPTSASGGGRVGVEPIEGRIEQRRVPVARASDSQIGFFLDGAQRTLPHSRIGLAPVTAVVAAVGIVQRESCGECLPAPGSLKLKHVWLIPNVVDPHLERFRQAVLATGMEVRDPLESRSQSAEDDDLSPDYTLLQELALRAANQVREEMEMDLLAWFREESDLAGDPRWLVVDGRLRLPRPRSIGIVKQPADGYLTGPDAETLLSLPPGYRTTAFVPQDRRRGGPAPQERTLWYLRLWPADGLDARHALVRVEVDAGVTTTRQIDEISSWLMAERTPRATGDQRWATLLYPIHHLERMLKLAIDSQTRGW